MINDEIKRILNGISDETKLSTNILVDFKVECLNNSKDVLERAKEVIILVLEHIIDDFPSLDEWNSILPSWFIQKLDREITEEELNERLKLPIEERLELEKNEGWSLSSWIYWFESDMRQWYWWDSKIINNDSIELVVEVEGSPFAKGALEWLFMASGAVNIKEN